MFFFLCTVCGLRGRFSLARFFLLAALKSGQELALFKSLSCSSLVRPNLAVPTLDCVRLLCSGFECCASSRYLGATGFAVGPSKYLVLPPRVMAQPSNAASSVQPGRPAPSVIKRAAALRAKYRIHDNPQAVIPSLVAQHPKNRHGMAINGQRVDELLRQVLGHFDDEEASFGAVAVEENPKQSVIRDYNQLKQAGDLALAGVSDAPIPYGSVGASTINQVLRNIAFGASTELAPEIADSSGKLSLSMCSLFDSALAEACSRGLRWEILSYKIAEEEDGIDCVQAGLNERAAAQMMQHEMQSIRQLAKFCSAEANAANEVSLGQVRAKLAAVGAAALAESPGFIHLFRFVLEQGGAVKDSVLEPLFEYHEKFVNPRIRRLREHHFKDVIAVDEPWLRLALIQAAYGMKREKIRDSWIDYFGPSHMSQIMKKDKADARELAGNIMKTFHCKYTVASAYEHLPEGQRTMFLGRLGIAIGRVLLGKEGKTFSISELEDVASAFEQDLRKNMPPAVSESLGKPMGKARGIDKPAALAAGTAPSAKKELAPVLIRFDPTGNAKNTQQADAAALADPEATQVQITDVMQHMDLDNDRRRCTLWSNLLLAHEMFGKDREPEQVVIMGDPTRPSSLKVYARKVLPAGTLLLLPLVTNMQSICTDSHHPDRVATQVCLLDGRALYIAPCVRLPKAMRPALAGSSKGLASQKDCQSKDWVAPLWHIRREEERSKCNCAMTDLSVTMITTIGAGGDDLNLAEPRVVSDMEQQVPVCTNFAALAAGQELVLFKEQQAKAKGKPKKPPRTWMQEKDAKTCFKKQRSGDL